MTMPGREKPRRHGLDHFAEGPDPAVGGRYYVGTEGVDGVDDQLAQNPDPRQTGGTIGPPPFVTGTNAFALDADGNPGDGLWYRETPHGVQVVCGGGLTGLSPGDVIATLTGVRLPDSAQTRVLADTSSKAFTAQLLPSGDLVYVGPLGIDGGGP